MDEELIAHAEIGDAARRFVESELGQCVLGMAKQEVEAAQVALEMVDPENAKEVRELQNKAKLGRQFEEWLVELITKGENALEVWKHGQEKQG